MLSANLIQDTHKVVTLLQQRGFTEQQAQAVVEVIQEVDTSRFASETEMEAGFERMSYKFNIVITLLISLVAGVVLQLFAG